MPVEGSEGGQMGERELPTMEEKERTEEQGSGAVPTRRMTVELLRKRSGGKKRIFVRRQLGEGGAQHEKSGSETTPRQGDVPIEKAVVEELPSVRDLAVRQAEIKRGGGVPAAGGGGGGGRIDTV